jgi:hypothetical protein
MMRAEKARAGRYLPIEGCHGCRDRGGNSKEFIAAREAYVKAKKALSAARAGHEL